MLLYKTGLFPFIFDNFFIEDFFVPEGYELVEKKDHKEKRLELEQKQLKNRKKNLLKLLDEVEEQLSSKS